MIENFLYKTIQIDNYENIINELSVYAYAHEPVIESQNPYYHLTLQDVLAKCPSINLWFMQQGIRPRVCAIITIMGDGSNHIHVDSQKNTLALNFGIKIPEGSFTGIYKQIEGSLIESKQPNGIPRYLFKDAKFLLIDKFDLHMPTLFNTKVPHGVFSPFGMKRISLSFRFVEDPWRLVE
jgi:hypothetical protein